MTHDEMHKALADVKDAVHKSFEDEHGTHRARLGQFDSHVATLDMVLDHIHDEAEREEHRVAEALKAAEAAARGR